MTTSRICGSRLRRAAGRKRALNSNVTELTTVQLVSLGLAAIACGWDLRTRRIPQVLTLGGAAAGLAFHLFAGGW